MHPNLVCVLTIFLCFEKVISYSEYSNNCETYFRSDQINVHLIPHSHDDVGWKETFQSYYDQGFLKVKNIYDTVIEELGKNSERT